MDVLGFLALPLAGCMLLILIHAYFGIHILERGIIFVDLAMAQFIALGIACALYFGGEDQRTLYAAGFAGLGSLVLSFGRKLERLVNVEAFIGVLYVFSLAASLLLLDRTPHGAEEFKALLNGNILWITPTQLIEAAAIYGSVGLFHLVFRKPFFALTWGSLRSPLWEFLFFLSFAVVLVSSVQLAGVLQVFSFLVIPGLIGRLFTRKPAKILLLGWVLGIAASVAGVSASYALDLPTAPFIVAAMSGAFFLVLGWRSVAFGEAGREQ
jgi:zinc/manganese transport system permease protein